MSKIYDWLCDPKSYLDVG